jgi:uncharacterized protein YkwD
MTSFKRPAVFVAITSASILLAACASAPVASIATPPFYQRLDIGGRNVDPASSLSMLNQYRANNGVAPVVWDPAITRAAQAAADRMAAADKVQSSEEADLPPLLSSNGVRYRTYVINLSAGYRTFAEAFSGWRELKAHNAVMLDAKATRIGLATSYVPASKYKIFWSMVLVEPM